MPDINERERVVLKKEHFPYSSKFLKKCSNNKFYAAFWVRMDCKGKQKSSSLIHHTSIFDYPQIFFYSKSLNYSKHPKLDEMKFRKKSF